MINKIIEITEEAGKIVSDGFYADKHINYKGNIDLVTEYDVATEDFLKDKLSKLFPTHEIVGEESSEPFAPHSENSIYIDPIDGTTNFVHGFPFVAISIGVYTENVGQYGVVYNPILGEMFYGEQGKGSFMNNKRLKVSNTDTLEHSLIATGFPYHKNVEKLMPIAEKVLRSTRGIRRAGAAAIDMCYVARGTCDVYYETYLKPWDIAAGMIILKEAGGTSTDFKGIEKNLKSDDIVASNGILGTDILDIINEYFT